MRSTKKIETAAKIYKFAMIALIIYGIITSVIGLIVNHENLNL